MDGPRLSDTENGGEENLESTRIILVVTFATIANKAAIAIRANHLVRTVHFANMVARYCEP